jgi:hypothetical protein
MFAKKICFEQTWSKLADSNLAELLPSSVPVRYFDKPVMPTLVKFTQPFSPVFNDGKVSFSPHNELMTR